MSRTMALLVCYDGTRPAGWQTQANAESVQSALESAVYSAFGERVRVAGSGRTDSGVHAAGQVCSFRLENGNVAPERVADALNRFLPDDIRVLQSAAAAEGFDACRSAKLKTYRYQVYVSARENPLKERYSARVPLAPDLQTMREAARELVGEHDFKSFCASGSAAKTTVREVISITVEESESYGSKDIRIDVMRASGNGGQCVNTTDSAVRLTHYPTGIVIYSQTEKSQLQNKEKAFALLRAKLYDIECQKQHDAEAEARKSQIGTGDRSEKIRTYNFPQGRVTDHRIGLTLYKLDKIMNGDIQEIIDACIAADQSAKLANMNEE